MLLYLVASSTPNCVPLVTNNFSVVASGVFTGLQSCMLTLFRISEAYLSCVNNIAHLSSSELGFQGNSADFLDPYSKLFLKITEQSINCIL